MLRRATLIWQARCLSTGFLIDYHLNSSNVNANSFGKATFFPTDGEVYAQLLFVPGLSLNGQMHNVVFGATEVDSVYAWDQGASSAMSERPPIASLRYP